MHIPTSVLLFHHIIVKRKKAFITTLISRSQKIKSRSYIAPPSGFLIALTENIISPPKRTTLCTFKAGATC